MYPLQIQFSITDIIVLQVLAIILGFIIHFALMNRRKLQAMIEESKKHRQQQQGEWDEEERLTGLTGFLKNRFVEHHPIFLGPGAD